MTPDSGPSAKMRYNGHTIVDADTPDSLHMSYVDSNPEVALFMHDRESVPGALESVRTL